ncbi:hypothetical protein DAI22_05g084200 [Oryza sativa Japonica Group]|nr:hypothetical protein DAI22_05g084200 [Oryza sativa Japonica Group]
MQCKCMQCGHCSFASITTNPCKCRRSYHKCGCSGKSRSCCSVMIDELSIDGLMFCCCSQTHFLER